MHDEVSGLLAELRLREISDQIMELRHFLSVEPNNQLLINLLEEERRTLTKEFIKVI